MFKLPYFKGLFATIFLSWQAVSGVPGKHQGKKRHYKCPNLTVVIVVDQLAYHYIQKVRPFLKHGLYKLLETGVSFHDATHPHAMPTTPTGHATISTGALPYVHGIVGYGYTNQKNEYALVTDAPVATSAVFAPGGVYDLGVGPDHLMVDTICDQFRLLGKKGKPANSFAISYKPRSAVMLAGFAGKAIWVDDKTGRMTSSKAYFPARIPQWLDVFNAKHCAFDKKKFKWTTAFPVDSKPYASAISSYKYSAVGQRQIGKKIQIDINSKEPFKEFSLFPHVDNLLLQAAKACIGQHCNAIANKHSKMLLLVSLSGFDLSSHILGPDSPEQLDKIYHLDRAIGDLINYAQTKAGAGRTLFVLTSDHGCMPIPEILKARGVAVASRVDANEICKSLDQLAQEKYKLSRLVKQFESPQFFFDKAELQRLSPQAAAQLTAEAKALILATPGIKNCWTGSELLASQEFGVSNDHYKDLFVRQAFPGRVGDLVCQTLPYNQLSKYPTGTSHCTPYKYDVHVPLAFYQSKFIDRGDKIFRPVCMTSLAPTIAHLVGCQAPSGSVAPILSEVLLER